MSVPQCRKRGIILSGALQICGLFSVGADECTQRLLTAGEAPLQRARDQRAE